MKAVVFKGMREVGVDEVRDAAIEEPTDVVLRITSSALCGTDLHMYDGRTGAERGLVLGHEPLGVVEATGSSVELVTEGDRVVVPTHLFCGLCFNCVRGYSAACLRVRPGSFGAAYGYAGMGPYRGAQAELLRIPYADAVHKGHRGALRTDTRPPLYDSPAGPGRGAPRASGEGRHTSPPARGRTAGLRPVRPPGRWDRQGGLSSQLS